MLTCSSMSICHGTPRVETPNCNRLVKAAGKKISVSFTHDLIDEPQVSNPNPNPNPDPQNPTATFIPTRSTWKFPTRTGTWSWQWSNRIEGRTGPVGCQRCPEAQPHPTKNPHLHVSVWTDPCGTQRSVAHTRSVEVAKLDHDKLTICVTKWPGNPVNHKVAVRDTSLRGPCWS